MKRWAQILHPAPGRLALVLSFLLVLSACQQSASDKPKGTPPNTGTTIETVDRKITIKMIGADNADFTGTSKLRIQAPGKGDLLNLMVISTDGFIDVGGSVKLSIGISLAGLYKGDGEYILPPNVAPSPGATSDPNTAISNSRVTFYADNGSGPERTLRAYDTLTKPCPVVIKQRGQAGEVHCPEIRSVEKTTVSFDMAWGE